MTRRKKLIEKVRARPSEIDYDDIHRLLLMFGWTLGRQKGSHCHFVKEGHSVITIATHGNKVKRTYVVIVCERLNLDEWNEK